MAFFCVIWWLFLNRVAQLFIFEIIVLIFYDYDKFYYILPDCNFHCYFTVFLPVKKVKENRSFICSVLIYKWLKFNSKLGCIISPRRAPSWTYRWATVLNQTRSGLCTFVDGTSFGFLCDGQGNFNWRCQFFAARRGTVAHLATKVTKQFPPDFSVICIKGEGDIGAFRDTTEHVI